MKNKGKTFKQKFSAGIIITLFSISYLSGYSVQADFGATIYDEIVGWIPISSPANISMDNVNVVMEIDATNHKQQYDVHFEGDFSFINHDNDTNMTIACPFPFYNDFYFDNTSILLQVNGEHIPYFETIYAHEIFDDYDTWFDFCWEYKLKTRGGYYFVVCNVSFIKDEFLELHLMFDQIYPITSYSKYSPMVFGYITGTSRTWWGETSETVEIQVIGKQPHDYADYEEGVFEKTCEVSKIDEGKTYKWSWEEERIEENGVWVYYREKWNSEWSKYITIGSIGLGVLIIACVTFIIIRKRKLRKKM